MMSRLLPFVTVLAAIGLFFGYINPTYTTNVAKSRAEIESYDKALAAAATFVARKSELLQEQANIPADGLARVEAFLPDGVDNVQLLLDLDSLASRTRIKLSDFETSDDGKSRGGSIPVDSTSAVDTVTLSVTATGTYDSFRSFLEGVEQSLRPLDLNHLSLTSSETGVYTYSMTFNIYWLR